MFACQRVALTDAEQLFRRTFMDLQPLMQAECVNAPPPDVSGMCLLRSVLSLSIERQKSVLSAIPADSLRRLLSPFTPVERKQYTQMLSKPPTAQVSANRLEVQPEEDAIPPDLRRREVKQEPLIGVISHMMHANGDLAEPSPHAAAVIHDHIIGWLKSLTARSTIDHVASPEFVLNAFLLLADRHLAPCRSFAKAFSFKIMLSGRKAPGAKSILTAAADVSDDDGDGDGDGDDVEAEGLLSFEPEATPKTTHAPDLVAAAAAAVAALPGAADAKTLLLSPPLPTPAAPKFSAPSLSSAIQKLVDGYDKTFEIDVPALQLKVGPRHRLRRQDELAQVTTNSATRAAARKASFTVPAYRKLLLEAIALPSALASGSASAKAKCPLVNLLCYLAADRVALVVEAAKQVRALSLGGQFAASVGPYSVREITEAINALQSVPALSVSINPSYIPSDEPVVAAQLAPMKWGTKKKFGPLSGAIKPRRKAKRASARDREFGLSDGESSEDDEPTASEAAAARRRRGVLDLDAAGEDDDDDDDDGNGNGGDTAGARGDPSSEAAATSTPKRTPSKSNRKSTSNVSTPKSAATAKSGAKAARAESGRQSGDDSDTTVTSTASLTNTIKASLRIIADACEWKYRGINPSIKEFEEANKLPSSVVRAWFNRNRPEHLKSKKKLTGKASENDKASAVTPVKSAKAEPSATASGTASASSASEAASSKPKKTKVGKSQPKVESPAPASGPVAISPVSESISASGKSSGGKQQKKRKLSSPVVVTTPSPDVDVNLLSPSARESLARADASMWDCPSCTVKNPLGLKKCAVCNNRQPTATRSGRRASASASAVAGAATEAPLSPSSTSATLPLSAPLLSPSPALPLSSADTRGKHSAKRKADAIPAIDTLPATDTTPAAARDAEALKPTAAPPESKAKANRGRKKSTGAEPTPAAASEPIHPVSRDDVAPSSPASTPCGMAAAATTASATATATASAAATPQTSTVAMMLDPCQSSTTAGAAPPAAAVADAVESSSNATPKKRRRRS